MVSTVIDEEVPDADQEQRCQKAMAISQHSGVLGVAHYDFESQLVCSQHMMVVLVCIRGTSAFSCGAPKMSPHEPPSQECSWKRAASNGRDTSEWRQGQHNSASPASKPGLAVLAEPS